MVSRIEVVLILAIVYFGSSSVFVDTGRPTPKAAKAEKELEITKMRFEEANQSSLLHTITADTMTKYPTQADYERFALYTPQLELRAAHVIQKGTILRLDQNATVTKADGTRYHTGVAVYDRGSRQLKLSQHFSFSDTYGNVKGADMHYDVSRQAVEAQSVKADYEIR